MNQEMIICAFIFFFYQIVLDEAEPYKSFTDYVYR